MPEQEPALATARVLILEPVRVRDRAQAFEPEPVQAFEQASAQVPVSVSELVRELASELARERASVLARERAFELVRERERASGLAREPVPVGVQPALWARCPWLCLCLSRWQWCRSAPARRQ